MDTVIAVKFNQRMINGIKIIDTIRKYRSIDEIILFFNGVPALDVEKEDNGPEITIMETESEVSLDKVFRQIISYVHQSRSEGMLYILDGSDRIPESDVWLDTYLRTGILLKDNAKDRKVCSVMTLEDLFKMNYPLGFVPILRIEDTGYALQSRNLLQFVKFFINDTISYVNKDYSGSIADMSLQDDKYDIELLDPSEYSGSARNIIKYLLNRIK